MSYGEVTRQNILYIPDTGLNPTTLPINANPLVQCCTNCPVFASNDPEDTDTYKNDEAGPIKFFSITLTVTMFLQKRNEVTDAWETVATLNDNTYGTYFDLRVKQNIRPVGYRLSWQKVLLAFGIGEYRVQWDYVTGQIQTEAYCLEIYTADAVDETVRINYYRDSIIGASDQKLVQDFEGLNWFDQVRICNAIFGNPGGSFEKDIVRLVGGFNRPIQLDYKEDYTFVIKKAKKELHDAMRYNILMADVLEFTDYNSANMAGQFIDVNCQINSEYRPNWNSASLPVTLTFVDGFNNRRKLYA